MRRLSLIENEALPDHASLSDFLTPDAGFECLLQTWDSQSQELPIQSGTELLLYVAEKELTASLRFFERVHSHRLGVPMIVVLDTHARAELLQCATEIADDLIFSPVRAEELKCRIHRVLGSRDQAKEAVQQNLKRELGLSQLVGEDPTFAKAVDSIPAIASSSAPVLLFGETGTGKELFAQAIHALSARHSGPFVPVECGALPENLVENELFGHVRGAFTDAHNDQKGLAAMADGGTLFLDEIDSLSLGAQAKLLRFVQEGTYRPLGSQRFAHCDVRLIAACNRDLESHVQEGHFRGDLFFRLNVLPLSLPPLKQRRGDIELLARSFLREFATEGSTEKQFSRAAMHQLNSYDWPGNVRELHNVVRRAVALCADSYILPIHLGLRTMAKDPPAEEFSAARSRAIALFEKGYLEALLKRNAGNVTRAAQAAGKDRCVLGRLMKKYQIDRHKYGTG